jgi:hypothetical protein
MFLLGIMVIPLFVFGIILLMFELFESEAEAMILLGVMGATASEESNKDKEPKPTEQQVIINLTPEEYNALIQENSKE